MADIEKTRLSNDDRALWNPYLSRAAEMVRALTNVERRNQKRRETDATDRGTGVRSAGQLWRVGTERRTETRTSSKDSADARNDAVNKVA